MRRPPAGKKIGEQGENDAELDPQFHYSLGDGPAGAGAKEFALKALVSMHRGRNDRTPYYKAPRRI